MKSIQFRLTDLRSIPIWNGLIFVVNSHQQSLHLMNFINDFNASPLIESMEGKVTFAG